jgi:hypothetical protein
VLKNGANPSQGSNARYHALGESSFQTLWIPDRKDSFADLGEPARPQLDRRASLRDHRQLEDGEIGIRIDVLNLKLGRRVRSRSETNPESSWARYDVCIGDQYLPLSEQNAASEPQHR